MYKIQGTKAIKVESVTFSELNMIESDVEELLRTNIDMVCDEEESMLTIIHQVNLKLRKRHSISQQMR